MKSFAATAPQAHPYARRRNFGPNRQTMLRCSISDLTEHGHFDLKTPSLCGIRFSVSSVVSSRWTNTVSCPFAVISIAPTRVVVSPDPDPIRPICSCSFDCSAAAGK